MTDSLPYWAQMQHRRLAARSGKWSPDEWLEMYRFMEMNEEPEFVRKAMGPSNAIWDE